MEWTAVKKISTSDFQIEAGGTKIGEDILLYVKGGEKPHIGCTVIAVPRPSLSGNGQTSATSSVLNLTGHKDESLCRTLAEMVAVLLGKTWHAQAVSIWIRLRYSRYRKWKQQLGNWENF